MPETTLLTEKTDLFTSALPDIYLFVCTGNTCRSPMAAALFNALWADRAFAVSAGISASGSPISKNAFLALKERGIESVAPNDYASHISSQVTEEKIASATRVYAISQRHLMALVTAFPEHADKISALPFDITDPYGGDLDTYKKCLSDIERALIAEFGEPPKNAESAK